MSVGAVLFGVAVAGLVMAYVARPSRGAGAASVDRRIEAWVAQARSREQLGRADGGGTGNAAEAAGERTTRFCPACGQRVDAEDRFCSSCGRQLRKGSDGAA